MFDLVIAINFSLLLLTFYTLCIICDEYLVPAVEVFIKQFNVPEEVAAVTLVAFGSAAPELFLNSVSAVAHTSDLSLAAILGSGMIAFGLIPPLCFLSIHREEVNLKLAPILRECGFYIIGLLTFLMSLKDGRIGTNEAFMIVLVYVLYVSLVIAMYVNNSPLPIVEKKIVKKANSFLTDTTSISISGGVNSITRMNRSTEDSDTEEEAIGGAGFSDLDVLLGRHNVVDDIEEAVVVSTHSNVCERTLSWINHCIATPISAVLCWVMPQLHPQPSPAWIGSALSALSGSSGVGAIVGGSRTSASASALDSSGGGENDDTESLLRSSSLDNYMLHDSRGDSPVTPRPISIPIASSGSISGSGTTSVDRSVEKVPLWRAILVLVVSIVCIGFLAGAIVSLSEGIVRSMGIDTSTLGATLVALGAEIPDTISSITLAKNGYYDGAIAGAIGSQVINISLGVGLPALFVCLTGDGYLTIAHGQSDSLWFLSCLLFVVVASYVAVTVPINTMLTHRIIPDLTKVGKPGAIIQIFVWCAVYAIFIYNNEHHDR